MGHLPSLSVIRRRRSVQAVFVVALVLVGASAVGVWSGPRDPERRAVVDALTDGRGRRIEAPRAAAAQRPDSHATVVAASGDASSPMPSNPEASKPVVMNVRDFGAVGDGLTDDTRAIQRADEAVARAGRGTVEFPPGTYVAYDVKQDSNVRFDGSDGATLKHPDGVSPQPIVSGRTWRTTGSVATSSKRLVVADPRPFAIGGVVAVRAAAGPSAMQSTVLAHGLRIGERSLSVRDVRGFYQQGRNFVSVDGEVVSYAGTTPGVMLNVARGLFGTRQVSHRRGAPVEQLGVLYARVVGIRGHEVELDRPARITVKDADVFVGSVGMSVTGLRLDGARRSQGSSKSNPFPLEYGLARWVTITRCTIVNGDHGAINLDRGTQDATVTDNDLFDNGAPSSSLGSAVWMFRGANHNLVSKNRIGGQSYSGITVDDRTVLSTEWDAASDSNSIIDNEIEIPEVHFNSGIQIVGSANNRAIGNRIRDTFWGVSVMTANQGTAPRSAENNIIRSGVLLRNYTAIFVTGSTNDFLSNEIVEATRAIEDKGSGNTFSGNSDTGNAG